MFNVTREALAESLAHALDPLSRRQCSCSHARDGGRRSPVSSRRRVCLHWRWERCAAHLEPTAWRTAVCARNRRRRRAASAAAVGLCRHGRRWRWRRWRRMEQRCVRSGPSSASAHRAGASATTASLWRTRRAPRTAVLAAVLVALDHALDHRRVGRGDELLGRTRRRALRVHHRQVEPPQRALQRLHHLEQGHLLRGCAQRDRAPAHRVGQLPALERRVHVLRRDAREALDVGVALVEADQPAEEGLVHRAVLQRERRAQPRLGEQEHAEREPADHRREDAQPRELLLVDPAARQACRAHRDRGHQGGRGARAVGAHPPYERLRPAHVEVLELAQEEVVQPPLLELLVGLDVERLRDALAQRVDGGQPLCVQRTPLAHLPADRLGLQLEAHLERHREQAEQEGDAEEDDADEEADRGRLRLRLAQLVRRLEAEEDEQRERHGGGRHAHNLGQQGLPDREAPLRAHAREELVVVDHVGDERVVEELRAERQPVEEDEHHAQDGVPLAHEHKHDVGERVHRVHQQPHVPLVQPRGEPQPRGLREHRRGDERDDRQPDPAGGAAPKRRAAAGEDDALGRLAARVVLGEGGVPRGALRVERALRRALHRLLRLHDVRVEVDEHRREHRDAQLVEHPRRQQRHERTVTEGGHERRHERRRLRRGGRGPLAHRAAHEAHGAHVPQRERARGELQPVPLRLHRARRPLAPVRCAAAAAAAAAPFAVVAVLEGDRRHRGEEDARHLEQRGEEERGVALLRAVRQLGAERRVRHVGPRVEQVECDVEAPKPRDDLGGARRRVRGAAHHGHHAEQPDQAARVPRREGEHERPPPAVPRARRVAHPAHQGVGQHVERARERDEEGEHGEVRAELVEEGDRVHVHQHRHRQLGELGHRVRELDEAEESRRRSARHSPIPICAREAVRRARRVVGDGVVRIRSVACAHRLVHRAEAGHRRAPRALDKRGAGVTTAGACVHLKRGLRRRGCLRRCRLDGRYGRGRD
mmetsp:Transcript_22083/g.56715  ORF Transcript_22083/g.56715 Transcript_22083/m.56715 type:complete len:993 (-) Transcript_22083:290-3268(-)